jgi:hypothetical protein
METPTSVAPSGETMLLDAGPTRAADRILAFMDQNGIAKIDYVVDQPLSRKTTWGRRGTRTCRSFRGAGTGGSHPHLVHEFVSSVVEGRASFPDVYQSVNWTCAGICAHESAMKGGELMRLPDLRG